MTREAVPGIRARNRAAIEEEILVVATGHLAQWGAAALSLRAVARDLGLAPSALYRYVASRDDLLTLLIVRAYEDLGDAVDAALEAGPTTAGRNAAEARSRIIIATLWSWAKANPHRYALIYGSPVPDYHAPVERTVAPGTRVQLRLAEVLAELARSGDDGRAPVGARHSSRRRPSLATTRRTLAPLLEDPLLQSSDLPSLPPLLLLRGLAIWNLILGAINSVLFEQLGNGVPADPDAYLTAMTDLALELLHPTG